MSAIKMSASSRLIARSSTAHPSVIVRCQPQDGPSVSTAERSAAPEPKVGANIAVDRNITADKRPTAVPFTAGVNSPDAKPDAPFAILNQTTEAINGRAAMLGFVAAMIAEGITHQTVVSQVAGRYENAQLVEHAWGASELTFGAIVALVTLGSLAPRLLQNEHTDSRSFGPFTPGLEVILGRTAMMGFVGLIVVEAIKGSSLI